MNDNGDPMWGQVVCWEATLLGECGQTNLNNFYTIFLFLFFFFFLLFSAALAACGSSQVSGRIRAVAVGLYHSHSNRESEPLICKLYYSSWQCWILNPLRAPRDQTQVLMGTSHYCWAIKGTPLFFHMVKNDCVGGRREAWSVMLSFLIQNFFDGNM